MSQQKPKKEKSAINRVKITSYPKVIYLWPTWAASFIIWLITVLTSGLNGFADPIATWIWMFFFIFNLFVVSFDFSAGKILLVVAFVLVLSIVLFSGWIIPSLALPSMSIQALFYLVITIIFSVIYLLLFITRQVNYLEVTSQQIIYHVGLLADERRYPAPSIQFEKKTEDVFEYLIPPFCGRLVLKTERGESVEILETVPLIKKKLSDIREVLEHLKVEPVTAEDLQRK